MSHESFSAALLQNSPHLVKGSLCCIQSSYITHWTLNKMLFSFKHFQMHFFYRKNSVYDGNFRGLFPGVQLTKCYGSGNGLVLKGQQAIIILNQCWPRPQSPCGLSRPQRVNTLRPRQMDAIWQTTFSSAFSWMKMFEFLLNFHWSLFLRVELTIFQHWFR